MIVILAALDLPFAFSFLLSKFKEFAEITKSTVSTLLSGYGQI